MNFLDKFSCLKKFVPFLCLMKIKKMENIALHKNKCKVKYLHKKFLFDKLNVLS